MKHVGKQNLQAGYSSELLFVINLALSKISVLVLLRQITPARPHQIAALSTMVLIGIWSVASFFASAFQCGIPNPWEILGSRCFHQVRHQSDPMMPEL
jgi:hypothetical protein